MIRGCGRCGRMVNMVNGEEKRKFKELKGQGVGMMIYLCVHRFKN